jgi:hypothetical protein
MTKRSESKARGAERRVVVELYRRSESGRLLPNGLLVTEYGAGRRGGSVAAAAVVERRGFATLGEVAARR